MLFEYIFRFRQINKFRTDLPSFEFKGQKIHITEVGEPSDINWNNLYVDDKTKFIKRTISLSILITLLALIFYALLQLFLYKEKLDKGDVGVGLGISILI